ncbi:helix-turn-helix domain-containing protein (plasmid) [Skermanella sp. TT6]|uniref:Helix-turn-helix domain-containing protein n=1 Tax=Skermanella cutis TaxID=2775420 RepID=A0ABX7BGH9_9PROT|nr:helix-turn-helix domain-containing protein [Skermanella sp. TT6]QQP93506.1 helix-turn-helix domain-containing protein [Skermanella sp. TT6]
MNALIRRPESVVPTDEDARLAAELSRVLAASRENAALRVQLDDGRALTLPMAATRLLEQVLTEMAHGNAVTLIPVHAELTTQEAADYLNVSRPYLVRLLEENFIPFHKVGTHRRVRFQDLKTYKEQADAKREMAMGDLVAQAQELDLGY